MGHGRTLRPRREEDRRAPRGGRGVCAYWGAGGQRDDRGERGARRLLGHDPKRDGRPGADGISVPPPHIDAADPLRPCTSTPPVGIHPKASSIMKCKNVLIPVSSFIEAWLLGCRCSLGCATDELSTL